MIKGIIMRGVGGNYYVDTDGGLVECRARGLFRLKNIKPLVGDRVLIRLTDDGGNSGYIEEIKERSNEMVRPPVANVEQLLVFFSVKSPEPNFLLLDKLIIAAEMNNLKPVICFNKSDLADEELKKHFMSIFTETGYKVIFTSIFDEKSINEFKSILKNKSSFEILNMPFVCGVNPYYLPQISKFALIEKNDKFKFELIEKSEIPQLYNLKGFDYALKYNVNSLIPEELVIVIKHNDVVVGIASALSECKTMWSINVDVLSQFRCNNLATIAVNLLTNEVLNREVVPYYFTDISNVASQRVAVKSDYIPSWSHCFRTRIDLLKQ